MLKLFETRTSSGTGPAPTIFPGIDAGSIGVEASNSAEIAQIPLTLGVVKNSPRPLSAIGAMALAIGPADLSDSFRAARTR